MKNACFGLMLLATATVCQAQDAAIRVPINPGMDWDSTRVTVGPVLGGTVIPPAAGDHYLLVVPDAADVPVSFSYTADDPASGTSSVNEVLAGGSGSVSSGLLRQDGAAAAQVQTQTDPSGGIRALGVTFVQDTDGDGIPDGPSEDTAYADHLLDVLRANAERDGNDAVVRRLDDIESRDVIIEVVRGEPGVLGGNYGDEAIDLDDLDSFPDAGGDNPFSKDLVLLHEIVEQDAKQNGMPGGNNPGGNNPGGNNPGGNNPGGNNPGGNNPGGNNPGGNNPGGNNPGGNNPGGNNPGGNNPGGNNPGGGGGRLDPPGGTANFGWAHAVALVAEEEYLNGGFRVPGTEQPVDGDGDGNVDSNGDGFPEVIDVDYFVPGTGTVTVRIDLDDDGNITDVNLAP